MACIWVDCCRTFMCTCVYTLNNNDIYSVLSEETENVNMEK